LAVPIYEYRCSACQAKFSLLIGMIAAPDDEVCPKCSSKDIARLVSKFRRGRTEDDRVDELADRMETMGEPESASEMRDFVKEMGKASDDEYGDDFEAMFEHDMEGGMEDDD
jgi:putative FmdB family regulatory protein